MAGRGGEGDGIGGRWLGSALLALSVTVVQEHDEHLSNGNTKGQQYSIIVTLFVWLMSHRPAVLFSHNKPVISNQPAVLYFRTNQHQPSEHAANSQFILRE
jgi:hypothetical protein